MALVKRKEHLQKTSTQSPQSSARDDVEDKYLKLTKSFIYPQFSENS